MLLNTKNVLSRSVQRSREAVVPRAQADSTPVGDRLQRYLRTPFDVLAFGPRAGFGALQSLPEQLQNLQNDVNKVMELAQDPRPIPEKQEALIREVEDRIVSFLDKGIAVETDVLSNVKSVLPLEAVNVLNGIIPDPPTKDTISVDPINTYGYQYSSDASSDGAGSTTYYGGEDIMAQQIASEMQEIKAAVAALKQALDAVRTNTDVANTNILRRCTQDARDQLYRRLNEVSPATANDPTIAAATREARILLDEVDASFSF